jgi:hypothetical protein
MHTHVAQHGYGLRRVSNTAYSPQRATNAASTHARGGRAGVTGAGARGAGSVLGGGSRGPETLTSPDAREIGTSGYTRPPQVCVRVRTCFAMCTG